MKYAVSTLVVLIFLILISPSINGIDSIPNKETKQSQPEIFSDKPSSTKCIDKIQIQQRVMVQELKKIKILLKKKKKKKD
jgi:hypothetical protein